MKTPAFVPSAWRIRLTPYLISSFILLALLATVGCQSMKRDGMTVERAIRLKAADHGAGLQGEHDWLRKHLPGARLADGGIFAVGQEEVIVFSHRTETVDRIVLSVYTLQLPDGTLRDVYFDQSLYFGKDTEKMLIDRSAPRVTGQGG